MNETAYNGGTMSPAFIFVWSAFALAIALVVIIAQWKVYQKAGQPGWASIVPIYNLYILLKIVGKPGWWILLMLIPIVNIYFGIKTIHLLSRSFGKDVGFTLGLIFLALIFYPILGFGSATYQGPYGDPGAYNRYQNRDGFEFENQNR